MNGFSPREEELLSRLSWFVNLRWLFLMGLGMLLFFAINVFKLKMRLEPVIIIALVVLIYNLGFFLFHRRMDKAENRSTPQSLRIEANLQIGLDLLALVFLIHYSGGIENPFIFFFVFHMIMGSILLSGRDIWFHAAWTIFFLFLLLGLSYFNIIRHYNIGGFASADLWKNEPYILAGAVAFAATIFMSVYMTNSISNSVRHREDELIHAKNQLEKNSRELESANRELIRQQNLLIQSEKLASLGKLSAGIAHELNSPLTGIMSFAHFIKGYSTGHGQVQNDIGVVIRETERCKKIIKGLLDFARQSETEKKEYDVAKVLNRTITLVENHKDFKDIEIIKDFDENLPRIMFDPDQIQQVFMNIIVNAQEAMPSGGTLYIRARQVREPDRIEVRVQDTGHGMDEETMSKIFDPFFTTKDMGTGLGLSISMGIVHSHHGELEMESRPGDGSAFIVRLPVAGEENQGEER